MSQGYYRNAQGYTPDWPEMDTFKGQIVHPQSWPDDLDYAGKRVVVIGSGATAATLIPAIAADCSHVSMLQRSPTYFFTGRNANALADELRELEIDETWIHEIVRRKILHDQAVFTARTFSEPEVVKEELLQGVRNLVGVFGYSRVSWTLRADRVADFVCRLLNPLTDKGWRRVVPALRPEDADMPLLPWIDPEDFNPGYVMRGMHLLPKRGK